MAMLDTKIPDMSREKDMDRKLHAVLEAMEQMKKQFQHALNHLGAESLSDELQEKLNRMTAALETAGNAADKQSLNNLSKRLDKGLENKADAKREKNGETVDIWDVLLGMRAGTESVKVLKNGSVQVDDNGLAIGSAGMDKNGDLNAKSGRFSSVLVEGAAVLTSEMIAIGAAPADPASGMVWIEPDTTNSGWNNCTVHYYK